MNQENENDPALQHLVVNRDAITDTTKEAEWTAQNKVLVPHELEGYAEASIKKELENGEVLVEIHETGERMTVSKHDTQTMNTPRYHKVDDLFELPSLNNASVLFTIKKRYYEGRIYVSKQLAFVPRERER